MHFNDFNYTRKMLFMYDENKCMMFLRQNQIYINNIGPPKNITVETRADKRHMFH